MTHFPLVSIGLPVHNEASFVRETLSSLRSFDYPDYEICITVNGSTDGTEQICREVANHDPRVTLQIFEENRGALASWNNTFRMSKGRYFLWSGGHDLWHPAFLSRAVGVLQSDEDVVCVYSYAMRIDASGRLGGVMPDYHDTRGMSVVQRYKHILWQLNRCNLIHGMFVRETLAETRLFSMEWEPDKLLIAAMSLRGTFAQIPEPLFFRRIVRGPEDQAQRSARIREAMTAGGRSSDDPRALTRKLRNAHFSAIRETALKLGIKLQLYLWTWLAFAVRRSIVPGGGVLRRVMGCVPRDLRRRMYASLFSRVGAVPRDGD